MAGELWPTSLMGAALLYARLAVTSSAPHFTAADNPIAHNPKLLTRVLSMGKVWTTHATLLIFPNSLSFDWSMDAVPLIDTIFDPMNLETLILIMTLAGLTYRTIKGFADKRRERFQKCGRLCIRHQICHDKLNNNVVKSNKRVLNHDYCKRKSSPHSAKLTIRNPSLNFAWLAQRLNFHQPFSRRDGCSPEHVS
ncbi:hypothetical protein HAZT_HAZT007071 [Hyalella azteca]|uniref:DUF1736 domain-containing protein n=1 Tax=Hyalella azteca TaxID=294128 RepID=A0A6A0H9U5_HYAAZ|nr:hypothetical protein HAZT_HAZT007071 [Hyalella azteca]